MSVYSNPDQYEVTTRTVPQQEGGSSGSWVWIILIILLILAIIGLIIWVVLLYRRNPSDRKIQLTGANVEVISPTEIKAVWGQTSSTEDIGTLYATLDPPKYNNNGTLTNANILKSSPVSNGGTQATVSKLTPGLKYYATLIITNNHTSNFAVYNQIVYMATPASTPPNDIEIQIRDILQVGAIERNNENVTFKQIPSEEAAITFFMGGITPGATNGQITQDNFCLYDNNGTLSAKECSEITSSELELSRWVYNHDGLANRWCLANTVDQTRPKCMVLGPITNGPNGTATIKVTDQSEQGDGWATITNL